MENANIVLIGFMGSGKSSVSNKLGKALKKDVISTDRLIEAKEGRSIENIFKEAGEAYFRGVEGGVIREAVKNKGVVIDCGGGVVLNPQNVKNLKKTGVVFYLCARAEFLYEKIKDAKDRPLLEALDPLARMKELLQTRSPLYEQAADYVIQSENRTIDQMCQEILAIYDHA